MPALRGFATLSPERRRELASKGGKSVPASRRGFSNKDVARKAGSKGGKRVAAEKRAFSRDPELAKRAGSMGGAAPRKATGSRLAHRTGDGGPKQP